MYVEEIGPREFPVKTSACMNLSIIQTIHTSLSVLPSLPLWPQLTGATFSLLLTLLLQIYPYMYASPQERKLTIAKAKP